MPTQFHVDIIPSDRATDCDGNMEHIGVWVRKNGEWATIWQRRKRNSKTLQKQIKSLKNILKINKIFQT